MILGLVELYHRYSLLGLNEDEEDLADSLRIDKEVANGKQTLYSAEELWKKLGIKL